MMLGRDRRPRCYRSASWAGSERAELQVLLVVDRAKARSGIWGMVWTSQDDDPRLLESKRFRGEAALKVWLAGIVIKYGLSNITVDWTDSLKADVRLASAVKQLVDPMRP